VGGRAGAVLLHAGLQHVDVLVAEAVAGAIPILIPDLSLRAASPPPVDITAMTYAQFSKLQEVEQYLRKKIWSRTARKPNQIHYHRTRQNS
jgi:hypothetical protein